MRPHLLICALALLPAGASGAERFAVYGDTRTSDAEHARIVAALAAAKPALALFTGDAAMDGSNAAQWDHFQELEKPLASTTRLYPVRGNHDTGPEFPKRFSLPPEGARGGPGGFYYAFDALGLHFLGLDSELPLGAGSEQLQFAKEDLLAHAKAPTIVFLHRALYSSGHHGPDASLQAALQPLLESAHVLAVFQGHDHDYERTRPIRGVTYFVEGGGGAALRKFEGPAPSWSAFRYDGYGYMLVDVLPSALDVQAFDSSGNLLDRTQLPLARARVRKPAQPSASATAP